MKTWLCSLLLLPVLASAATPELRKFADAALFAGPQDRVHRWVNGPLVSCATDRAEERALFDEVTAEFNQALGDLPMRLLVTPPGTALQVPTDDRAAVIHVHFCEVAELPAINRLYGIARERSDDQAWRRTSPDGSIKRCVVVMARRGQTREEGRRQLVAHLLFATGFSGPGMAFGDSFYTGKAPKLGTYDVALIQLLYSKLTPGMKNDDVRAAVNRHWAQAR